MKHYLLERESIREVHERVQRDAARIRLAHLSQGNRPGLTGRLLAKLGGWMVAQGTRLQAHYAAANTQLNRRSDARLRPAADNVEILLS